jgi:hypothetical protein
MTTTQTTQDFISQSEWDIVSFEQKSINARRHNTSTTGDCACKLCGRTISDKVLDKSWHVHMTVDCKLVAVGVQISEGDSQGWFPVGSDCAKKIPTNFRKKFL